VPATGGVPKRLTFADIGPGVPFGPVTYEEYDPVWSHDGDRLTFSRSHVSGGHPPGEDTYNPAVHRAWHFDVFSVDPFSGPWWEAMVATEVNYTNEPFLDQNSPAWSPDGNYLLYSAEIPGESMQVYDYPRKYLWAQQINGDLPVGTPIQLTAGNLGAPIEDQEASFSPDGAKILLTRLTHVDPGESFDLDLFIGAWPATPGPLSYTLLTEGGWGRWRPGH